MPDAGLDGDVVLDIRQALRQIDKLEEALDRAVTGVVVTADTRAVTAAIDAAIQNADSSVEIVGDAAELTGEITAAVEAGENDVTITGDASELTGDVTAAIDEADTHVVITGDATELTGDVTAAVDAGDSHVVLTADSAEAVGAVNAIDTSAAAAIGSASRLQQVLAGIGAAGIAKLLYEAAQAASDLGESGSKAEAVFGTATPEVARFALAAAVNLGLSEQAALEAAGTFGNLFQALGLSQQAAADLSPDVLALASDLASFNNLGIDDTLEKIRSGLVGEIEPLRGLGISFNAAQVDAKALELGLADASGAISEGAKVQARWQLITEQSTIAAGDFARTSGGLANQQRILTAEFQNAVAEAGQALLPTLLDLVQLARDSLIPTMSDLGETVLPAVASILAKLAPLLGTTLDLLLLISPVIEAVAGVIDLIPDPLIAAAGALLIFNKATSGLSALLTGIGPALKGLPSLISGVTTATPAAAGEVGLLARGVTGLGASLGALSIPTAAVAAGGFLLFKAWEGARERARAFQEGVDALAGSLETIDGIQQLTIDSIETFASESEKSRFVIKEQEDDLTRIGTTYREVAVNAEKGAAGLRKFTEQAVSGGEVQLIDNYGRLVDVTKLTDDQFRQLAKTGKAVGDGQEVIAKGNSDLLTSFADLADQTEAVAEAQLQGFLASDDLTQAQIDQALAVDRNGDATRSYIDALNDLQPELAASNRAAERTLATYGPLADQFVGTAEAMASLREEAPDVARQITSLELGADATDKSFLSLALSIGDAELSEEGMANAARRLGTDVDTLTGIVEEATGALDDFVNQATSNLPSLSDAFSNVGEDSILSAREFIDGLNQSTAEMAAFQLRLDVLTRAGFTNLAGIIAQQGPEVGGKLVEELVTALQTGHEEIVEEAAGAVGDFNDQWESTADYFRETIGPKFILEAGLLGTGLSEAFGSNLSFSERIRIRAALAKSALTEEGQAIAAIAAVEGERAARDYGVALDLDTKTVNEAVKAGLAIADNHPETEFRNAGLDDGKAYVGGIVDGMTLLQDTLETKAAQLALAAHQAASGPKGFDTGSPSKLGIKLGGEYAEGIALGIEDGASEVVAQAEKLVQDAFAAVSEAATDIENVAPTIRLQVEVPDLTAELAAVAVAPLSVSVDAAAAQQVAFAAVDSGIGGDTVLQVSSGAVSVTFAGSVTETEARRVGAAVLDGIVEAAAQRQIAVDLRATGAVR